MKKLYKDFNFKKIKNYYKLYRLEQENKLFLEIKKFCIENEIDDINSIKEIIEYYRNKEPKKNSNKSIILSLTMLIASLISLYLQNKIESIDYIILILLILFIFILTMIYIKITTYSFNIVNKNSRLAKAFSEYYIVLTKNKKENSN